MWVVLRALHGRPNRPIPAGNHPHHPAGLHPEGRRALTRIHHPQTPARPRPDVKQPPSSPHPHFHHFDDGLNRRQCPPHGFPGRPIGSVHPFDEVAHPRPLERPVRTHLFRRGNTSLLILRVHASKDTPLAVRTFRPMSMKSSILLAACALSFSAAAQSDTTSNALPLKYTVQFADARHDFNIGNLRGALTTYRDLLDELPNDARAMLWIARCHAGLRREDLALQYLDKVAAADEKLANSEQRFRGEVLHALGRYEEAITAFTLHLDFDQPSGEDREEVERFINECRRAWNATDRALNLPITHFGAEINSRFDEYAPHWSPDGTAIAFTSRRDGGLNDAIDEDGDFRFFSDIYVSQAGARAVLLPGEVNSMGYDALLSWPSKNQLFVYRNDEFLSGDICVSVRDAEGNWGQISPLPKPVNSTYYEGSASLTQDGNTLYFISERPEGLGRGDVYVSERRGGGWSKPEHLGPVVNTDRDEKFVQALDGGRVLVIASNGHAGYGGYDLYRTEFIEGGWSVPVNLGMPINGPREESTFSLSPDGKQLLITAERPEGYGERDIYQMDVTEHPLLGANVEAVWSGLVTVTVRDAAGEPVADAQVRLRDTQGVTPLLEVTTDKHGETTMRLPANVTFVLEASARKLAGETKWIRSQPAPGAFTDAITVTVSKPD